MGKLLIQIIGVVVIVFCLIKTNFLGLYNPYSHSSGSGLITHEDLEMTPQEKQERKKKQEEENQKRINYADQKARELFGDRIQNVSLSGHNICIEMDKSDLTNYQFNKALYALCQDLKYNDDSEQVLIKAGGQLDTYKSDTLDLLWHDVSIYCDYSSDTMTGTVLETHQVSVNGHNGGYQIQGDDGKVYVVEVKNSAHATYVLNVNVLPIQPGTKVCFDNVSNSNTNTITGVITIPDARVWEIDD